MSQAISNNSAPPSVSTRDTHIADVGSKLGVLCWQAWRNYWFGPGFALSYAFCRIAVGVIFLYAASQFSADYATDLSLQDPDLYQPVGVLYLFGKSIPPSELFTACKGILAITGWTLIFGFFSRISLVAGLFAFMCLASLESAFDFRWGHRHPPVLLTALALLVGPAAPYSLDALIRRWRGLPVPNLDRARTAVLLAQFMLASVFLNAAIYKLYLGNHKPFAWCYSDNMRNTLLYQYWILRRPMPDFLQFVVDHEWTYKGMAVANITMQLLPLAACFLVRRPMLRFLCGTCFALEVHGLGMVMGLWNLHWLLLATCFIDWDRLTARLRALGIRPEARPAAATNALPTIGHSPALLWSIGMAGFIGFHLYVSFYHLDQRRFTFPITSYPMYSAIYAQRPFGEHLPFRLYESTWKIDATPPLTEAENTNIWINHHWAAWQPRDLHSLGGTIKGNLEHQVPGRTVHSIAIERTVFEIAAFPDHQITPITSGLAYRYDRGHHVSVELKTDEIGADVCSEVIAVGLKNPRYRIGYQYNFQGPLIELSGQWQGNRFTFPHPCRGKGRSFLVVWLRDETLGDSEVLFGGSFLPGGSTSK